MYGKLSSRTLLDLMPSCSLPECSTPDVADDLRSSVSSTSPLQWELSAPDNVALEYTTLFIVPLASKLSVLLQSGPLADVALDVASMVRALESPAAFAITKGNTRECLEWLEALLHATPVSNRLLHDVSAQIQHPARSRALHATAGLLYNHLSHLVALRWGPSTPPRAARKNISSQQVASIRCKLRRAISCESFGSCWIWLALRLASDGPPRIVVLETRDATCLVSLESGRRSSARKFGIKSSLREQMIPLLCIDVFEHQFIRCSNEPSLTTEIEVGEREAYARHVVDHLDWNYLDHVVGNAKKRWGSGAEAASKL